MVGNLGDNMIIRFRTLPSLLLGGLTFLVLFPGFYFYHFSVAHGWILPFLGGMFGLSVILFFPLLFLSWAHAVRQNPEFFREPIFLLVLGLLAWSGSWMALNLGIEPGHPAHLQLASTLVMWVALFWLGCLLPLRSSGFKRLLWATWSAMWLLAFSAVDASVLMSVGTEEGAASYQGLSRSMMVTSCLLLAISSKARTRILIAGASIIALFLIGARSELYGFIPAYSITEFLINRKSRLGQIILIFGLVLGAFIVAENLDLLSTSRQLEVLNLSQASSWVAREYMTDRAWEQIFASPIFGLYGGHWLFGSGDYAHNALSAWVSLGLIGFTLYVALCVFGAVASVRALVALPFSGTAQMATLLNVSSLLLIILAKPVFWEMPAFAWGLAAAAAFELRSRRSIRISGQGSNVSRPLVRSGQP
jgi:hypothetical protein